MIGCIGFGLVAPFPLPTSASDLPSPTSEPFTATFAKACIGHYYSQEKLRKTLIIDGATPLPKEQANAFLSGRNGVAWSWQIGGVSYVLSTAEGGICALFAQRADVPEVRRQFENLVATAPPPLVALKERPAGPNHDDLETISYSWSRPEDKTELLFTLTSTLSERRIAQAMASIAEIEKPK